MGKVIDKTDTKFIVNRLYRANIIIKKEIYKSNLFWLLLTFNESLILKIVLSKLLLSR